MLFNPVRNIVGQADVKASFGILKDGKRDKLPASGEIWLRGRDLNPRSGSCRTMSRSDADL